MAVKMNMPVCPECNSIAELKRRKLITGNNDDNEWVWVCKHYPKCDTYVGCHPSTFRPLGTMAGYNLRQLRWRAHKSLDTSWRGGHMTRSEAYEELALALGVEEKDAHIGMLNKEQCEKVVEVFDNRKPYKVPKII